MVGATEGYVRIIIRRPHAYWFLNETFADEGGITSATPAGCVTGDGKQLPLPGLYVIDTDGSFLASTTIRSVEEVTRMLDDPEDPSATDDEAVETVSIRVSGFMADEGIT